MHTKSSAGYKIFYNSDLSGMAKLQTPDGHRTEFSSRDTQMDWK